MSNKKKNISNQIRKLLGGAAIPLSSREIARRLNLKGQLKKKLEKELEKLISNGEVVRLSGNRYTPGTSADLAAGKIRFLRSGEALVTTEGSFRTVRISRDETSTALPGDRVLVRMEEGVGASKKKGQDLQNMGPRGEVIKIIERQNKEIVGTLHTTKRFSYVSPLNPSFKHDFYVTDNKHAKSGDRVLIRFLEWHNRQLNPEAEIIEVIGSFQDANLDTLAVIRNYSLPEKFPAKVLEEAALVVQYAEDTGGRLDLRKKTIITIDPERARDFDDALSLERDGTGNLILGVHIADVSHYVKKGSALDKEALQRGNSVYLPDKVIPMLPEELSNNVCSLMPGVDRLAFSVFITFDASGNCLGSEFARSVICSSHRFNYREALAIISGQGAEGKTGAGREVIATMKKLARLSRKLRKKRLARNALDFDLPDTEVIIDKKGMITEIRKVENDQSHQLVEEFMLAANEAVAIKLNKNKYPLIYRIHEAPRPEKFDGLLQDLFAMGYRPGNLSSRHNLAKFVRSVKGDPLEHHVHTAILRCMNRAIYSARNAGHFGLSMKLYTHFTSPIRRYSDLVVHRQLASLLEKNSRKAYKSDEISQIAMTCSTCEQIAAEAENTVVEIKKYRYLDNELKKKKKPEHDAVVVKVTSFGMFVELEDIGIQGLVHISDISNKYVRYNRNNSILRAGNKSYKLGTELKVKVQSVKFEARKIDFKPA